MILVTGATGFVGRNLVASLLNDGFKVKVLLRPGSNAFPIRDLDVEKIMANPYNIDTLESAVRDVDYIVHCAGVTKGFNYDQYYQGNVLYTQNLLEAVKKYSKNFKKFIFLSSQAASGPSQVEIAKKETDSSEPISWYGNSKLHGEKKTVESGIPYIILRPSSIYGPGDREFFSAFKMAKNRVQAIVGNGKNLVNLLFIDDLIQAIAKSIKSKQINKIYFVTGKGIYSWKDVQRLIKEAVGKKTFMIRVPKILTRFIGRFNSILGKLIGRAFLLNKDKVREMLQKYWLCDISSIKKEIGYEPKYLPEVGFKITYEWYIKEGWL